MAQTWRPRPCRPGKHKVSHQLNNIGYSRQLTAAKTRNQLTSATWPYRGHRCSLWWCLLDDEVAQDGAQRKYSGQLASISACSLHLCNLTWEMHFMVQRLSKQGIRWPVSSGRIAGSSVELTEVTWIVIGSQAQVFSRISRTSQKIGSRWVNEFCW